MAKLTRRLVVHAALAAVIATAGCAAAPAAPAAPVVPTEQIERYDLSPSLPGIPLISFAVARGNTVYVSGITANPASLGDVKDQTRRILARIDQLLAKAGTSKAKLLSAQVWLTDMSLFAAHNEAWNEWVDPKNPPARACLLSPQLWRPGMLVEIMVVAAR